MPKKSKPLPSLTHADFVHQETAKLRLTADEREHLRIILNARSSITGKAAKISMVFEHGFNATAFIERLLTRVDAAAWKAEARHNRAVRRALRGE